MNKRTRSGAFKNEDIETIFSLIVKTDNLSKYQFTARKGPN